MYCKFLKTVNDCQLKSVLIVAKCIVNLFFLFLSIFLDIVLIVAKCIVNYEICRKMGIDIAVLIVAKCIVNYRNL